MAIEHAPSSPPFLVLGPTGAGITTALNSFARLGYMTVSHIAPEDLAGLFPELLKRQKPVAIALGLGPSHESAAVLAELERLRAAHPQLKTFFLDAPDELIMQRFNESQKTHPFDAGSLTDAIAREKALYQGLFSIKDYSINTSTTNPEELYLKIAKVLGIKMESAGFTVNIVTFGFKYGMPMDAELVFDMRFMTNPFYIEELRPMTGLDQPIKDYIFGMDHARSFFEKWSDLVGDMLPLYQTEGKTRLSIAVGCTGGKHRSVCMAMALADYLAKRFPNYTIVTSHREMLRWGSQPKLPAGDVSTHA